MDLRAASPARDAHGTALMFFRKSSAAMKATVVEPAPAAESPAQGDSLDALGDLLRVFGEQNLETEDDAKKQVAELFARWSVHVLVGKPMTEGAQPGKDYRGAVRAFRMQRKGEVERFGKAIGDLRGAVWSFVTILSKAAFADGRTDAQMKERLERLRVAVESGDHDVLRTEAQGTVVGLTSLLVARAEEHKARMAELATQVRHLGRELEEAKKEGEMDALTRLFNRACFDRFAERTAGLAMLGTPASLLMIDVDHFKKVNDAFGHPVGDVVLRAVADAIFRTFPRRDDLVARYGGEEFAVVLRNTKRADAEMLAERLLRSVRSIEVAERDERITPTVSIGVAELDASEGCESWLRRADAALYRAKQAGRNRSVVAD